MDYALCKARWQENTKFALCTKKEVLKQCTVMYDSRKTRCLEKQDINKAGRYFFA